MIHPVSTHDLQVAYLVVSSIRANDVATATNAIRRSRPNTKDVADVIADDVKNRPLDILTHAMLLESQNDFPAGNSLSSGFHQALQCVATYHVTTPTEDPSEPAGDSWTVEFRVFGQSSAFADEISLPVHQPA